MNREPQDFKAQPLNPENPLGDLFDRIFGGPTGRQGFTLHAIPIGRRSSESDAGTAEPGQPVGPEVGQPGPLGEQVGGRHYKGMGSLQPYETLAAYLTREEYIGYMKGTALTYLARANEKGGLEDIQKAHHTLDFLLYMLATRLSVPPEPTNDGCQGCEGGCHAR